MLIVLSPAKALDYETAPTTDSFTYPGLIEHSKALIEILRECSPAEVARLMKLSDQLAALNVARYAQWQPAFSPANSKQAMLAFDGDVYDGLAAVTLEQSALDWAQQHLRILSGLYGVLRPLDLMQPYRLEMGTRLANSRGATLYAFWGGLITDELNRLLEAQAAAGEEAVVVNLASTEYFKSVRRNKLRGRLVTPMFEDWKGGRYKIISFFAKRARGLMSRYAIDHRLGEVEGLKDFDAEGYRFSPEASDSDTWVFRRRMS